MRVWLLRHAKSSWEEPGIDDHDRPLSPRGERAAERMHDYIASNGIRPELVLCSSGLRARQTLARVLAALGSDLEILIEPDLYTFDAGVLLGRLTRVPERVASVLLVGHNPAIQELATMLADRGEGLDRLAERYPTGALAQIELPARSWHDLPTTHGALTSFVVPRDLG